MAKKTKSELYVGQAGKAINKFQASIDVTQVEIMKKAALDILDLKKEVASYKAEAEYQKQRADGMLEEVRGYEKDTDRTRWMIEHLIDYAKDIERIAK